MTTSTLILPASGEQDLASWAAIAFVASNSSPGTRQAYATQLRLWFEWCERHHVEPLAGVRRPHVELYARDLEAHGLAAATVALKLVVLTGFYRYCVEEQLLEHSPAVHVRRPKVSQESTRLGLDRSELGAFLVQAGLSGGNDHALACLLALNALRVSEACGADLSDLALANGHRVGSASSARATSRRSFRWRPGWSARSTLRSVSAPTDHCSPAPTAAVWIGTRPVGSCAAWRGAPGSTSRSRPTPFGTLQSPPPSTPGAACGTCRTSPGMPIHARPAATTEPAAHWTATPPTSSRLTSPEQPVPGDAVVDRHGCRVPAVG
jgi:hypothetical protein